MRLAIQEFRAVWAALIYFTRIRLPELPSSTSDDWLRAAAYFPLAGWLVGGFVAGVWWLASLVFSNVIAVGLGLASGILLTGAMHEDGLADVADGFGGGTTREKILEIMKDSRVGSYGAVALVLSLGLRWASLAGLPASLLPLVLVSAHAASRAVSISLMADLDYARPEGKARPLASRMGAFRVCLAFALGLAPLAFLPPRFAWALAALAVLRLAAARKLRRTLGGYTGDCLGAVQQLGEIVFLLTAAALS